MIEAEAAIVFRIDDQLFAFLSLAVPYVEFEHAHHRNLVFAQILQEHFNYKILFDVSHITGNCTKNLLHLFFSVKYTKN